MSETFAPSVVIPGGAAGGDLVVTPESWMWVIALAINEVPWAVDLCNDPTYDMRGKIDDYMLRRKEHLLKKQLKQLEQEMGFVKQQYEEVKAMRKQT